MSDEDLRVVLAHIEEDPNFARAVAADRRALHRFTTIRQPILHLTPEEMDNAVGQAIFRRDNPLTPEQRRGGGRNAPVPEAPCADKRRAVEDAKHQLRVDDVGTAVGTAAATAVALTVTALAPAGHARDAAYPTVIVTGVGGAYHSVSQMIAHSRALRRALAALQDCLYRHNLRADAERLGTTIAAIDDEITQLSTRAGVA